jgi:peptide/nickel transport system permease protein
VGETGSGQPVESDSLWRITWRRLRRNRVAMTGLVLLGLMYASAALAGPIAPYDYENQSAGRGFHPPMLKRIRLFDEQGRFVRPFVYGIEALGDREYREDRSVRYPIRLFIRGDQYHVLWVIRSDIHLFGVDQPGRLFLFGSDFAGRDLFSRILYGGQVSLSIGIVGILISSTIGLLVGGAAGYFSGVVDFVLMRLVEVLLALPSLYFILILRKMFESGASSAHLYLITVVVLAFIGWAIQARVIRGMVLSIKEEEYVLAARALGFSNARVIIRHILPNTFSFVIVTATLSVPFYIVGEVALSYLGVGITEPEPSWGNLLSNAQDISYFYNYPWTLIPGLFIFAAVMAWNFLGDGLRDAADPRTW